MCHVPTLSMFFCGLNKTKYLFIVYGSCSDPLCSVIKECVRNQAFATNDKVVLTTRAVSEALLSVSRGIRNVKQ